MDNMFYIINDNKVELSNGKEYSLVDFIDILVNYINKLETNRDDAIELIKKHFEEEYKKPREELKKYNLKNCTYDIGLVALEILERGKE